MTAAQESIFTRAGTRFGAVGATLYLDLSPLHETFWTGIPVVAAGLARVFQDLFGPHVRFFAGTRLLRPEAVADALARNTGLYLARDMETGHALAGPLQAALAAGPSAGLFPSVKTLRHAFDVECSIFHDLSTLSLPLFHIRGNVLHHMEAIAGDLASNDFQIAVSAAAAADLTLYMGVEPATIVVAPNGVAWPPHFEALAADAGAGGVEPYFLILGTREPRKNIVKVFELLEARPDLLGGHRFVFAGKMGWLAEQHALPPALEAALAAGRILFAGYVSEAEKYSLLRHARATLYPSYFEGFGLPVLESLSAGTPCVASYSSSLPEVGGAVCRYFDPFSAADFGRAIDALLRARPDPEACRARAGQFTWRLAAARILDRVVQAMEAKGALPIA